MNQMYLDVKFHNDKIEVFADISFSEKVSGLKFSLNKLLKIKTIDNHIGEFTKTVSYKRSLPFRPQCNEYDMEFQGVTNRLTLAYDGEINGWMTFNSNDVKALNFYSAWYPIFSNIDFDDVKIILNDLEDHVVINGKFDADSKLWSYNTNTDGAYNIIALRNDGYGLYSNEEADVYYLDECERDAVVMMADTVKDVLSFYNGFLFEKKEFNRISIVSFSEGDKSCGYMRRNLIVSERFGTDKNHISWFLGHELAHEWCKGADFSFEDWLNETTAEWAALLYLLSLKSGREYFDKRIEYRKQIAREAPPIKPADEKRPEKGIHSKGTVLFYKIYLKYGEEAIIELLRIFVKLEKKTTEKYIKRVAVYNKDIAEAISKGILI